MIIDSKNTTVAFRCPRCGNAILSGVNIFRLSGDMVRLRCTDCDEALTIRRASEGKMLLSVPCLVCARPHNLTVNENTFFCDDLFTFPCPISGIDTLFAGKEEKVKEALDKSAEELTALLDEAGIDNLSALHGEEEDPSQTAIEDVVHFLLCELEDEGRITCYCKEAGEIPLYDFQILSERVRVFCHCCNAEAELPLRSEADAEEFIKTDRIDLK